MTKRRAEEDTCLHDPASRRCFRSLSLDSMAPCGAWLHAGPPSLQALLGNRCRKRPHYSSEEGQQDVHHHHPHHHHHRKMANTNSDVRSQASDALAMMKTCVSSQELRTSTTMSSSKKRPREECVSRTEVSGDEHRVGAKDDYCRGDLSTFNSFQFWRVPLPELDLSLLEEDADKQSEPRGKPKVKASNADAMET